MIDMRRREFITLLGGAAAAWPLAARAQQPERMRRIGVLSGLVESDPETPLRVVAFRQALGKLGWSEGRNLVIDFRWGAGDPSLMRVHAKELIGATPDVVVAESTPAAAALRQETSAVSIVFLQVGNPVGVGLRREPGASRREPYWVHQFRTHDGRQVARVAQRDRAARDARHRYLQSRHPFRPVLANDGGGCAIVGRGI